MDVKREEYHDEIEGKGYPKLGERNEEDVTKISLMHMFTGCSRFSKCPDLFQTVLQDMGEGCPLLPSYGLILPPVNFLIRTERVTLLP
jgi:hypothetical protein